MLRKLIENDIKQNKLSSGATIFFMAVSAMLLALTALLLSGLLGAIDGLMDKAQVPDYMQMHTENRASADYGDAQDMSEGKAVGTVLRQGNLKPESSSWESAAEKVSRFAESHGEILDWQICGFLNLNNSLVTLGGCSLADSTQDNGLCVQGERFDYLLDEEGKIPEVLPGEVFVPVCYRTRYGLTAGDMMETGGGQLVIAGFIRDAQMNSMMASSKRFLVNKEDYEKIRASGNQSGNAAEEYLIEFLLRDDADRNTFATAYADGGLPANGPAITKPLVRMMNALSDGTMIFVIFLVSIVTLLISMLCVRFLCLIQIERERKEVGMLKALGVKGREIRRIYLAKYLFLSLCGGMTGLLTAFALKEPLEKQVRELYGAAESGLTAGALSFAAVCLAEGIILSSVWFSLKKTEKIPALEALFCVREEKSGKGRYLLIGLVTFACTFLALTPRNLYGTLSAPEFVSYMGTGNSEIRMDVRQSEDIDRITEQLADGLLKDTGVKEFTVLRTRAYTAILPDGKRVNLNVETGDHCVFPVNCQKGKLPVEPAEMALSAMNAEELGLSLGERFWLICGDKTMEYTVCGIYSDITNGGKTAKAYGADKDAPVIWSVLYASLKETTEKKTWAEKYRRLGADVTDIADYVRDTYGQTLSQLYLASGMAAAVAGLVTMAVTFLFIRLIVEEKRYAISLHKALGFTGTDIKRIYFLKGLLPVVEGSAAGIILGNPLGEGICAVIMKSFGADGFRFIISWKQVLTLIPVVVLVPATLALWAGISGIGKVQACECCRGRD